MTEFFHPLPCFISSLHILHSLQCLLIKGCYECLQHPTPWFPLEQILSECDFVSVTQSWNCIGCTCHYMKRHKCAVCMHSTPESDWYCDTLCLQTSAVRMRRCILAYGENLPSAGWNKYNICILMGKESSIVSNVLEKELKKKSKMHIDIFYMDVLSKCWM